MGKRGGGDSQSTLSETALVVAFLASIDGLALAREGGGIST